MRRIRKKKDLHLDIAPINLIDLLLVILVFFITTTSFLQLQVIDLTLPQSGSADQTYVKDHTHVVNINTECEYFLDAKKISSLDELEQELSQIINEDKEAIFQVGADRESQHHCFIKVLDKFNTLEIKNISILTKVKS